MPRRRRRRSPAAAPAVPEPPVELVQACLDRQCVLFAGAGLSVQSGMPTVAELTDGALEWVLSAKLVDPALEPSFTGLLDQGEADLVFEGLVDLPGGEAALIEYLKKALLGRTVDLSDAHLVLHQVEFSGIMTSNYDELLERAFQVEKDQIRTLHDAESLLEALSKNEFFLLKLFGALDRPETMFLTGSRYRDAVVGNQPFGQFLSGLFYSRTLLFAGKNLQGIEEFLASVPSRGGDLRPHFAVILPSETGWEVKGSSLKRRFGLELIVLPGEDDGTALGRFLTRLVDLVREKKLADIFPAADQERARIKRVAVENIGPFERLELDLHRKWNVLLGDNGVGKSSILKAIAATIVGEDAARFSDRLVRAGTSSASVTLTTERGETYRAELLRSESGVRFKSIPLRPLEKEGWLAVGFPPLRTVSWERPAPYDVQERGRAVSEDVLPLVRGETDPRLDKLKAWLLYLDHNIEKQAKQDQGDGRYRRLRDKFYEVVQKVTPGMTLEPGSVNAARRQVFVRTDDGEVPIEALSQGTQSLMGWIGIVLQRLFEVYHEDPEPTGRYVLVLMDEIDAHMHPHWQHLLVGTLKEIFPHAQFVATSHSPLVVSGLTREEIVVFRRDETTGRKVRIERPPEDLKGWRIDQILTSSTFGLTGNRDKETSDRMARYTELISKFETTTAERAELEELARNLETTVPSPHAMPQARAASKMIEEALRDRLDSLTSEQRKEMVEELRAQVQEAVAGARRPV